MLKFYLKELTLEFINWTNFSQNCSMGLRGDACRFL